MNSEPDVDALTEIDALCDEGKFLTALERMRCYAPIREWKTARALCIGGRLANQLGAPRLASRLWLRALREAPRSPEACYRVGWLWLDHRGPLAAWEWLGARQAEIEGDGAEQVGVQWLRAAILTTLRDFDRASEALDRAERDAPDEPYNFAMRAGLLCAQDRYGEALERGSAAIERFPQSPGVIHSLAHALELHSRFEDALNVLTDHGGTTQSGSVHVARARLEIDLGRHEEALATLASAERCLPWSERASRRDVAILRAEAAYALGDDATAIAEARRSGEPFFERIAERLSAKRSPTEPNGRRVLLNVPFVRQHHLNCVPATLAMLAKHWGRSADQLEIADRITYGGTSLHAARAWADARGWTTRAFTVTWDAARALLDRGIPFMVTTVHVTSAHAQAVIGYDERRGTLHIRDPFQPKMPEAHATEFCAAFAAHGPRGLAIVPCERAALLDGIELPECELYDELDALENALQRHDRAVAVERLSALETRAPKHRLMVFARWALAGYDANPFQVRAAIEEGLRLFPAEPTFTTAHLAVLPKTATRAEFLAELERVARDNRSHPVFREMLASELSDDGRRVDEAAKLLRTLARTMPQRAATLLFLATCEWKRLAHDVALELYRFAACLEPTDGRGPNAYFRAAVVRGRAEEALAFLRRRADRYLRNSAEPTYSLFHALTSLDRATEAFETLTRARAARPDDGELALFAAQAHARIGEVDQAAELLRSAESRSSKVSWSRAAASVATASGEHARAIELWRAVVEAEPLAIDAHAALASRLTAAHGPSPAREHLAHASARFPENADLLELRISWSTTEDPRELLKLLEKLIALAPSNAWAIRELVLTLAKLGRVEDARTQLEIARAVAPHDPSTEHVTASVAELDGDAAAVTAAHWKALDLSADAVLAIRALLTAAEDEAGCRRALDAIEARVVAGSVTGEGVAVWYDAARRHLEADDLSRRLASISARRGDLSTVWSARARHHLACGEFPAAIAAAEESTRRFTLSPQAWLELARCHGAAGDRVREIEALERAVAIAPAHTEAVLVLANALEQRGDEDRGRSAIDRGLRHQPLDPRLLLARGERSWRLCQKKEALASVRAAIEAAPSASESWQRLSAWSAEDPAIAVDLVRSMLDRRPWDAQLWLRLAEIQASTDLRAGLASIDRALEIDPLSVDAYDLKASLATRNGARDLAEQACRPARLAHNSPVALRGRHAWIAAAFGDVRGAIERMQTVVRDRPDYTWGFTQLADWHAEVEQPGPALEAARAVVRLEPTLAYSHGYLGDALAQAGDDQGARRAFRRAVELDPTYRFGVHRYLELLFAAKDFEEARTFLAHTARFLSPSEVASWELRIALGWTTALRSPEDRWSDAEPAARRLFEDRDAPDHALEQARAAMTAAHRKRTERWLRAMMKTPGARARIGAYWARAASHRSLLAVMHSLWRMPRERDEARAAALEELLEQATQKRRGRALVLVLANFRRLRSRDELWAQAGWALVSTRRTWLGAAWLADHGKRKVQPWTLLNVAIALRALGLLGRAARVSRRALELQPDHTSTLHRVYLALDACVAGRIDEAEGLLANVSESVPNEYFHNVRGVCTSLIALQRTPTMERRRAAGDVFSRLAKLVPNRIAGMLSLQSIQWRRVYRRAGRLSSSVVGVVRGYFDTVGAWLGLLFALDCVILLGPLNGVLVIALCRLLFALVRRVRIL